MAHLSDNVNFRKPLSKLQFLVNLHIFYAVFQANRFQFSWYFTLN